MVKLRNSFYEGINQQKKDEEGLMRLFGTINLKKFIELRE